MFINILKTAYIGRFSINKYRNISVDWLMLASLLGYQNACVIHF